MEACSTLFIASLLIALISAIAAQAWSNEPPGAFPVIVACILLISFFTGILYDFLLSSVLEVISNTVSLFPLSSSTSTLNWNLNPSFSKWSSKKSTKLFPSKSIVALAGIAPLSLIQSELKSPSVILDKGFPLWELEPLTFLFSAIFT